MPGDSIGLNNVSLVEMKSVAPLTLLALTSSAYNCNWFLDPPFLDPYSKGELGWASFTELTESENGVVVTPSYGTHEYYIISKGFPDGEYLIIENRQREGFDELISQVRLGLHQTNLCFIFFPTANLHGLLLLLLRSYRLDY